MAASKPLLHPPVSEVAFEINFPHWYAVEKGISEYQQKVSSQYPGSSEEFIVRLPTTAAFGKPTKPSAPRLTPLRSFVFQNTSSSRTVKVSVVNLSFVVTDYKDFEGFKSSLLSVVLPAVDIFGLESLERVGLRYINKILIPATRGPVAYQEYVRSPINLQAFPSSHFNGGRISLQKSALIFNGGKGSRLEKGYFLPKKKERTRPTCWIWTVTRSNRTMCPSEIGLQSLTITIRLQAPKRSRLETQFKGAVTEKYWNYMERGEAM